jgi:hypothetical protein
MLGCLQTLEIIMLALRPTLLSIACMCIALPECYGREIGVEVDYLKKVDPELYDQLLKVEQCLLSKKTAAECRVKLNAAATATPATPATATESTVSSQQNAVAPETKKQPLNWWLSSAYSNAAPTKHWSQAVQATFSFNEMDGDLDGSQNSVTLDYITRYDAWTNHISLGHSADEIEQSGVIASDRETNLFSYSGRLDLNKSWFTQAGYTATQDTSLFLQDDRVSYIGGGAYLLNSPKVVLNGFLGLGRTSESFSEANEIQLGLDQFEYNVAYASENITWNISKNLTLSQSLQYFTSLDDVANFAEAESAGTPNPDCSEKLTSDATFCVSDFGDRDKLYFMLGLQYKINKYVGLSYSFTYSKISQPLVSLGETNTFQTLGLSVNFQ